MDLLALSDHDTVDGVDEALAAGALHGVRITPATEISAVDGQYEDLHVLGYGIDHRSALLQERLRDARADRERRADAMAERLEELGFAVDPAPLDAAQGRRQAGGPPAPGPGGAPAPRQRRAARRGGPRRRLDLHPLLPDPGQARLRGAHPPDRGGGDRLDPRRGGRGRLGASVLGHLGSRGRCSPPWTATRPRASTGSRSSTPRIPRSRRCCWPTAAPSSGFSAPAPRTTTARTTSSSRASAHFDLHGREPNLGPIGARHAGRSARAAATGLCIWLTGLSGSGKSTVGRDRRRRAARPRLPRGDARRRRRAPEHLRRARLLARGPRDQRAPDRVRGRPARPQRRGRLRGGGVALPRRRATTPGRGWASASWRCTSARRWRRARTAT